MQATSLYHGDVAGENENMKAVVVTILAALIVGGSWAGYQAYERHEEAVQRQEALVAEQEREAYLAAETSATLENPTGGTASLITAMANGKNDDGSTAWTYHTACVAQPHERCSSNLYSHRGLRVAAKTEYVFLKAVWSPIVVVEDSAIKISAWRSGDDHNCCSMNAAVQQ